ncbi:ent-kaurene synthase protein [Rutstroemia sp. NJR-2017a WRK4]|nr:ent-kaurene synthase protein [Rutstroemia sp. NJR-2017a WRK4]
MLEQELFRGGGCLGFAALWSDAPTASSFLPDADDTAKSMLCLSYAKRQVSPEALIQTFDAGKCFKTYAMERNPSVSANCNVLNALLHLPQVDNYTQQITNIVLFIHRAWEGGSLRDKWNLSEEYSMMLLAQALSKFLGVRKEGRLQGLTDSTVTRVVPLILMQILRDLLQRQSLDGSWGHGSSEITAYSVLGLGAICSTQEFKSLNPIVRDALQRAHHFLISSDTKTWHAEPLWIEKICYTSKLLSNVYCISAVVLAGAVVNNLQSESATRESMKLTKMAVFFSGLPMFANFEIRDTLISLAEAALYRPRLEKVRLSMFEQTNIGKDQYLDYIPFTWVGCNSISAHPQSSEIIWDMIYASMLIYQVDEYMETSVSRALEVGVEKIRDCIRLVCNKPHLSEGRDARTTTNNIMDDLEGRLSHFVSYFLLHPSVQRSPYNVQAQLQSSMETFLQAHITQILDNQAFAGQESRYQFTTSRAYYHWVHNTSADHTSCSFSFLFYSCLVAEVGEELFETVKAKYYSQAAIGHLATLCRQYNDYGSIQRDEAESNLNSINFPEFNSGILGCIDEPKKSTEESKANLMELAEFEREGLNRSLAHLEDVVDVPTMEKVKLFVKVTDLYGQIYVARDITNRVK